MINRYILAIAFGLIFSLSAFNSSYAEAGDSERRALVPELTIESAVIDFGSVLEGDEVSRDFKIINHGGAVLNLDRISPTCGCTAVATSGNSIAPGASGVISAKVNTTGFAGDVSKDIRVYTNDPKKPSLVLTLKGRVTRVERIEPERVVFSDLVREELVVAPFKEVMISLEPNYQGEIKEIVPQGRFFTLKDITRTNRSANFKVVLDQGIPNVDVRERVVVKIIGNKTREINIPVVITVKSPFSARPSTVSFGLVDSDTKPADLVKRVQFSSSLSKSVRIKAISSDSASVTPSFSVAKEGALFDIIIKLNPSGIKGILRASVQVELDGVSDKDGGNLFTIPVFAMGADR